MDNSTLLSNLKPRHPISYPKDSAELEQLRLKHRRMLRPQHVAAHAMIPGIPHMSPSRSVMAIQQASQHLVWNKMDKPIVLTGVEYPFGDFAFKDKMPENGQIVAIVPRYPRTADPKTIRNNPETIVIYLREDQVLDYFSIKAWGSFHSQFGYTKNFNHDNIAKLVEGRHIPKGTVFAQSPGIADDGCYCMGINARVAYIDDEALAEDGMWFRQGFVDEKLTIDTFEEIEVGIGTKDFPLNSWGVEGGEYQIFPEIGEFCNLDGFTMAKRKWDTNNAPVIMSKEALRKMDGIFDDAIYTRPVPVREGEDVSTIIPPEVIDVVVIRNPRAKRLLPPTMASQLERYALAYQTFQQNLLKVEQRLTANIRKRDPKAELKMTERLQILFAYAYGVTDFGATRFQSPTEFQIHRMRADEWTVRLTIRHRRKATIGDKFTGLFGDKGVAVDRFVPDSEFPEGVDIMVASASTIGRTNTNRFFVPRVATAAYDLTEDIRTGMGFKKGQRVQKSDVENVPTEVFNHWSERLLKFYAITSPHLYVEYAHRNASKAKMVEHLVACLNDVIHPVMGIDNPIDDIDSIIHLDHEDYLKPYKHLTFKMKSGKFETTDRPIPVLWSYIEVLEKIAEDGSASSFGKLQHHGLLASRANTERHQFNFRNVSTRSIGQHESEILTHDARSPEFIAEMLDRSNNPDVMRSMAVNLLTSDKPTAQESLVDRKKHPLGESRPIQFLRHFYATSGAKLSYMSEEEAAKLPNLEEEAWKDSLK